MTNSVFITLGGKERRLKYDINAAAEIEELLGGRSLLFILGNPASAGFSVIRTLLWGGMKHAEKGLTLQRVGLFMQEYLENGGSLETISETIGEAVRRSGILGKLGEADVTEDSSGNE
jgi:hypothetical protein